MNRFSSRSLRRACAGATLAVAGMLGGTQHADASVAIGDDHGLAGTISPTTNLGNTYVAAFYGSGGSGGFAEVFKVATSINSGDDFNFVVDLDDDAVDFDGFTGYAVLSTYADGVVISFTPSDATSLITGFVTFADLVFGSYLESTVEGDLAAMDLPAVLGYAEDGFNFSWSHILGTNYVGDQSLVGFTEASAAGDVTNIALVQVPEPATAAGLALGGMLLLRRRRG